MYPDDLFVIVVTLAAAGLILIYLVCQGRRKTGGIALNWGTIEKKKLGISRAAAPFERHPESAD